MLAVRRRPHHRQHRHARLVAAGDEAALEVRPARPVRAAGRPTSSPRSNQHVDDLCFIHSMHTEGVAHGPATLFLHCGSTNFIRPVDGLVGALRPGHREREPARLRLDRPVGRQRRRRATTATPSCPPSTRARRSARPAARPPRPPSATWPTRAVAGRRSDGSFDLLRELNAEQLKQQPRRRRAGGGRQLLRARLADAEQRPGRARPRRRRSPETQALYGIGEKATDNFGRQCLMARRLCEAGVRFVQVTYGDNTANPAWDQHSNLPKHGDHARAVDQPDRRPARRPEAARPARRHARLVGRRVRPHALRREERHRPRPQPRRLHRLAGRRRRQARLRLRRDRRVRPPGRRRTRSTCTTCTRRSCTCSASTTRS